MKITMKLWTVFCEKFSYSKKTWSVFQKHTSYQDWQRKSRGWGSRRAAAQGRLALLVNATEHLKNKHQSFPDFFETQKRGTLSNLLYESTVVPLPNPDKPHQKQAMEQYPAWTQMERPWTNSWLSQPRHNKKILHCGRVPLLPRMQSG